MADELRQALAAALALGGQLLAELQEQPTEAGLARVEQLIVERGQMAERARELFQPGDQQALRGELEALLRQQRALDGQMQRWLAHLKSAADATRASRATTDGMRRVLGAGPSARQLDVRR
ncbi:hypothetical protein J2Z79_000395 [Symbiobacterium terraclitae]|uniref:Flagellar protein FlgN n=1 Tax=Symbiobacterium terraclitae TaxID=557451 RepID=A0ABS4JNB5_9FIRM|nr:hypothetical protein [Symbiobacterium terraclitae]MBP2017021.1 hypothetical protein [Symbiobacterium terraclitae]